MNRKRRFVLTGNQLVAIYNDQKLFRALLDIWAEKPNETTQQALITADYINKQFNLMFPDEPLTTVHYSADNDGNILSSTQLPKQQRTKSKNEAQLVSS